MTALQAALAAYLYAGPVGILLVFAIMGYFIIDEVRRILRGHSEGLFLHEEEEPEKTPVEKVG